MNGFQTARRSWPRGYPWLRAIFLTEYDLSDYAEMIGSAPVLAKPCDPETLIATNPE